MGFDDAVEAKVRSRTGLPVIVRPCADPYEILTVPAHPFSHPPVASETESITRTADTYPVVREIHIRRPAWKGLESSPQSGPVAPTFSAPTRKDLFQLLAI